MAFIVLGLLWAIPARGQATTPTPKVPAQPRSQPLPLKEQVAQLQKEINALKDEIHDLKITVDLLNSAETDSLERAAGLASSFSDRIGALEKDDSMLKDATGWLYTQQNFQKTKTCTVNVEKLRAALRDRYAVPVDVDCN